MFETSDKRIVYVTTRDQIEGFAGVVQNARRAWKPLIIHPRRLDDALDVLHPRVVVLDARLEDVGPRAQRMRERCVDPTIITDDSDLESLAGLLAAI
jgi:SpoU rRNA methylase family enzyme